MPAVRKTDPGALGSAWSARTVVLRRVPRSCVARASRAGASGGTRVGANPGRVDASDALGGVFLMQRGRCVNSRMIWLWGESLGFLWSIMT